MQEIKKNPKDVGYNEKDYIDHENDKNMCYFHNYFPWIIGAVFAGSLFFFKRSIN